MKQVNLIQIERNDLDVSFRDLDNIFDTYDVIWGGSYGEDKQGYRTTSKNKIKKFYDESENFRNFLEEIKQDVSWIDEIEVWRV